MENNDPEQARFRREVLLALSELNSHQIEHMNRLLAIEALLYGLLETMPPDTLDRIQERNDLAINRLAAEVPPKNQRKERLEIFADAILNVRRRRTAQPPLPPPNPPSSGSGY